MLLEFSGNDTFCNTSIKESIIFITNASNVVCSQYLFDSPIANPTRVTKLANNTGPAATLTSMLIAILIVRAFKIHKFRIKNKNLISGENLLDDNRSLLGILLFRAPALQSIHHYNTRTSNWHNYSVLRTNCEHIWTFQGNRLSFCTSKSLNNKV